MLGALQDWGHVSENFSALAHGSVSATITAFGLALISVPFVRSIRLGGFELQRPDRAPPLTGRSKALRANSVLHRNALLATSFVSLPIAPPAAAAPGAPDERYHGGSGRYQAPEELSSNEDGSH